MSWPHPRTVFTLLLALAAIISFAPAAQAAEVDVAQLTATIRAVGPGGEGHQATIEAWKELSTADAAQLPDILRGFSGAGPLAVNWLRPAVDAIAQRELAAGTDLPLAGLEQVFSDQTLHPLARMTAYEWIIAVDPESQERLLDGTLEDSSLELRRLAVAGVLAEAAQLVADGDPTEAIEVYFLALRRARDIDQVEAASAALVELGEPIDLAHELGFISNWQVIGPFAGSAAEGFEQVHSPEVAELGQVDLTAQHEGLEGAVSWQLASTEDPYGTLDLNESLGKHIEASAYAYADLKSETAREVELRLGSQNGTKIWLNGVLVASNPVYHTGANLDQFIGRGELQPGLNTILVKVHQDDPGAAPWAGAWGFQLRVVDSLGTPIRSAESNEQ